MSYRDDQIKILELICSYIDPFEQIQDEEINVIEISEDTLQDDGFSFHQARNLINDLQFEIGHSEIFKKENKRFIRIFSDRDISGYLFKRKYPNHEIESWIEEEEMASQFTSEPLNKKMSIKIDPIGKIFKKDKPEFVYMIKTPSKRFSLIEILCEEKRINLNELSVKLEQDKIIIMKAIKEINDAFMKKLSVPFPLIKRLDTSGYVLNRDDYEIELK